MDDGELTGAGPTTDGGPVTDRGRRTRDRLVVAARAVFAERGFADTRMSDVAERAGVSHGTVYVYFDSKAALMAAVVEDLLAEIGDYLRGGEADEAAGRIAEANLRYLQVYTEHARMLQVVEEAAIAEVALDRALSDFRAGHVARVEAGIRRLQGRACRRRPRPRRGRCGAVGHGGGATPAMPRLCRRSGPPHPDRALAARSGADAGCRAQRVLPPNHQSVPVPEKAP